MNKKYTDKTGIRSLLISMVFLFSISAIAEDSDYKMLDEIEKKFNISAGSSIDPNLASLLNLAKSKIDFKNLDSMKAFTKNVDGITKKIDSKKLGKASLAYKKVLLRQKSLAREAAKSKPKATTMKRYAEAVIKEIDKLAASVNKSAGSGAVEARKKFSEKELQKLAKEAHASLLTEKEYV
jgi:hypothetical protein